MIQLSIFLSHEIYSYSLSEQIHIDLNCFNVYYSLTRIYITLYLSISKMLFHLSTTSVIYWCYPKSPLILTSNNWRLYFSWLSNHWSLCKTTGGRKWQAQWQHSTLKNVKYALLPAHVHPLILQEEHSCHLKCAINCVKINFY